MTGYRAEDNVIFRILIVLAISIVVSHAAASTAAKITIRENVETRAERVSYAKEIRSTLKIDRLLDDVPRLSPSEKNWLSQEMGAGAQRMLNAARSKEFAINRVRTYAETMDNALSNIVGSEISEFAYWVQVVYELTNRTTEEQLGKVCARKIIQPCPFDNNGKSVWVFFEFISQTIIMGVIGPQFGIRFQE